MGTFWFLIVMVTATLLEANPNYVVDEQPLVDWVMDPIQELIQIVQTQEIVNPGLFDLKDLEEFSNNEGVLAAQRFLNQRSQSVKRAADLAYRVLRWRKEFRLNQVDASSFPCNLFTMGLIFEHGRAHSSQPTGEYIESNPVIWIRLGALGGVVKQLERLTPERTVSFGVNTPRVVWHKFRDSISSRRERRHKVSYRQQRTMRRAERRPLVRNLSIGDNDTLTHVLRAIAWWLDDWIRGHSPDSQATLVLDFEKTDYAFVSWKVTEFIVQLDDMFPDLFDRIIGFRYRAKLWSIRSRISMFNRIFKTRISSSPETDRKLRFVNKDHQISRYVPRVNEKGFTMLPKHVRGECQPANESLAPAGCQASMDDASFGGMFDPNIWRAVYNEYFYNCEGRDE